MSKEQTRRPPGPHRNRTRPTGQPPSGNGKPRSSAGNRSGKPGGNSKARRPAPGIEARQAAIDLLHRILHEQEPLDDLLDGHAGFRRLSPRDRAFTYRLVMACLRHLGSIDAIIDRCLERPKDLRQHDLRHVLRLGAVQLIYLDTPPHAAIDTSLKLAEARKLDRAKGLINAVLRRIGREPELLAEGLDIAQLETPEWLWLRWSEHYGEETARSIAKAHGREPTLDLTPKAGIDTAALAEQLEATVLPTGSLRRATGGSIAELPGYEDGTWWVQDAAAALPARLFGPDLKGKRIADLCAAPGGKTAQLAAAGAEVIALDRSAKRLERLSDNMTRLKLTGIAVKTADARNWLPEQLLDGVLLDAPCTATGTIRRQPDVAQLKTPDDLDALSEQQAELLAAAIDMVRPGGLIVYCTCSLEPEEGEAQIERLLTLGAPVRTVPIRAEELGVPESMLTPEGWLRILPGMELAAGAGDLDGFFAARLERLPDEAE